MTDQKKTPDQLRSARWFAPDDLRAFGHRSRAMQMGYAPEEWKGRPGHRDPQHLVGRAALPHALQEPGRRRQARRADGRRLPDGIAGAVAVGIVPEADHHALPQHAGDGRRGIAARPSRRRRGADGRLRQDHAGPAARRHLDGPAHDLPAGRADAARQLEGQDAGLRLRRLEILGRAARRENLRAGTGSMSRPASPAATAPA